MVIGSNEKCLCVHMPFDSFGQISHRKVADSGQNGQSCDFLKHKHIRDGKYPLRIGGGLGRFVFKV